MNKRLLSSAAVVLLVLPACIEVRDPNADGPDDPGAFSVAGLADPATVFEGGSVTVSATAQNGSGAVTFRWDQNSGEVATIADPASAQTAVTGLTEPGLYVFRVTATDGDGNHVFDYVDVDVLSAVTVEAPDFAIVNEPATLSAQVSDDAPEATYLWEVTQGSATFDDPSAAETHLTASVGETVEVRLTVTFAGDAQPAASREIELVVVPDLSPRVRIETNLGDFVVELDGENTPRHMVNFLLYVDEGFYDGLLFHRNACTVNEETEECEPFVLQGGGYRREGEELVAVDPTRETIEAENETSASNGELYTVALALRGGNTSSGAAQFFINLDEDNSFLDDSGFTVFARVVEGTDIVDDLAATERVESTIIPGEISLPAEDIVIEQMVRME